MLESDREGFAATLLTIGKSYGKALEADTLKLYWETLHDLSLGMVQSAIQRHMRDPERGRWMPLPSDILHQSGIRKPTALSAWAQVLDVMEARGAYRSVLFADGVTNAVIRDLGGWPGVCYRQANDEQEIWLQKEFERRYDDYLASGRVMTQTLVGLAEADNQEKALPEWIPETTYIEAGQHIEPKMLVPPPQTLLGTGASNEVDAIVSKLSKGMNMEDNK